MNSALLTDSYKLDHRRQYPEGTTLVFSNFTPRSDNHAPEALKNNGVVVFGIQMVFKKLAEEFDKNFFHTDIRNSKEYIDGLEGFRKTLALHENETLKAKVMEEIKSYLNPFTQTDFDTSAYEQLWDLGYLPIEVRALDEGTLCPMKTPMLTIHNTLPEFFWVTNYLETIISTLLWKPMTSATIALGYKKILMAWAKKTNPEAMEFVNWQGHDFSSRGLDSVDAIVSSGLGHLTSFYGSDSLPTLWGARYYYNEGESFLVGSVPATEHSVMCAGSKEDELQTFKRLLNIYPTGIVSVVSDTWDLWNVITNILPTLKKEIMGRDGKLVIRPDSGDPVDILCGEKIELPEIASEFDSIDEFLIEYTDTLPDTYTEGDVIENFSEKFLYRGNVYNVDFTLVDFELKFNYNYSNITTPAQKGVIELLWDIFGGTINEQGYKVLDSHIGAIYGDSITVERAQEICKRLESKGFASTNVVLGIGSFTYQYNTRDTFGFAMKATYIEKEVNVQVGTTPENLKWDTEIQGVEIFKDPVTDSGLKKSAKGLLRVVRNKSTDQLVLEDQITWEELRSDENLLTPVFVDGEFVKETTMTEIRERVNKLV